MSGVTKEGHEPRFPPPPVGRVLRHSLRVNEVRVKEKGEERINGETPH